ncbi:uncharacterized protein N7487_010800 [Penicillium crustosum]|uniref:uncharacterized protein n=1 Tax=Penicillium crustosum TaxID=36656 RepID=UPI00238283D9|nr:uncharacterized protein N7487_010800 [Penicillium crustosum]KAJ5393159.1 hypothetical protein N7487_010800 [Penicillium crustosum]
MGKMVKLSIPIDPAKSVPVQMWKYLASVFLIREYTKRQNKANKKVYVTPKNLFTNYKIDFGYDDAKHTPYHNNRKPKLLDDHEDASPSPSASPPYRKSVATKASTSNPEELEPAENWTN